MTCTVCGEGMTVIVTLEWEDHAYRYAACDAHAAGELQRRLNPDEGDGHAYCDGRNCDDPRQPASDTERKDP